MTGGAMFNNKKQKKRKNNLTKAMLLNTINKGLQHIFNYCEPEPYID